MEKGSGSGKDRARSRPFYELPSHIKPCSQIIQETRLQLMYSKAVQSREFGSMEQRSRATTESGERGMMVQQMHDDDTRTALGYNTMRTVNTSRPFTPRDSTSLWGVSAGKRPPSAITLSRLSLPIEDIDEKTVLNTVTPFTPRSSAITGFGTNASGKPASRSFDPKNSLGSLSSHSGSLSGIAESDDGEDYSEMSNSQNGGRCSAEMDGHVEKTSLQIKSLSLQNVTSSPSFPSWVLGSISTMDGSGDFPPSDNSRKSGEGMSVDEMGDGSKMHSGISESKNIMAKDQFQHINNIEVATEYLQSLVSEYATSDKPPKEDIISILKKIVVIMSQRSNKAEHFTSKLRKRMLELIFKLVEKNQNDENILFWSSFVLLHCNIIGNNLTTVFKMVFKSSKSQSYRDVVLGTEYLEVLMRSFSQICPKTQTESMIYGYGTLKFLCSDKAVLNRVIDLHLIPVMALHLKILNCEIAISQDSSRVTDGVLNGTFQLTSILRSVVGESRSLITVVQTGLLEQLCVTMTWAWNDIDVLTNIVRILSVVSMDNLCCQVMCNSENFCSTVVQILQQKYDKDDIMVRLAYSIGNLLAYSDDMRIKFLEEQNAFQSCLKVMHHYLDKSQQSSTSTDILIKITRVIANWILNPFVGSEICDNPALSDALFKALQVSGLSQELMLCVMCALNNTSFYINYTQVDEGTMKTANYLFQNLKVQDSDVGTESIKVLGNLTRNENVRKISAKYMTNISSGLESENVELLCATCGVLINIVIEDLVRAEFLRLNGLERIIGVLERHNDATVSLIVCQVIWNLLISQEGQDSKEWFQVDQRNRLKKSLTGRLKEFQEIGDTLGDNHDGHCESNHCMEESCSCQSQMQLVINDFCLVAKDLVAKL